MLDLKKMYSPADLAKIYYPGITCFYIITRDDVGFTITVEHADFILEKISCSTLSTAIASIEALENGEEI